MRQWWEALRKQQEDGRYQTLVDPTPIKYNMWKLISILNQLNSQNCLKNMHRSTQIGDLNWCITQTCIA